jgi:hypothetical protein
MGSIDGFAIYNASCPPDLNCALQIIGIHPHPLLREVFEQIHDGAVLSFYTKDPVPGVFNTCAINLIFQKRNAAESFLGRCKGRDGIKIRGRRIYAAWNRDQVRSQPEFVQHQSRVLWVTGPETEFDGNMIQRYLHTKIAFELVNRRFCCR